MFDIFSILLALGLLIFLAFRGVSVILLSPLMATLAIVLAGGLPILGSYTQIYMGATGKFIIAYFPLFLLGAIFGKLMDDCGAAKVIAQTIIKSLGNNNAILAVVICCGLLTYGGVSLFVVAFAVFPIAQALFRQVDIPKRLIPAAIALGSFTFTMSALPGTPAIQNAIPMPYFNTSAFASPGLGLVTGLIMLILGTVWLNFQSQAAKKNNEGYYNEDVAESDSATAQLQLWSNHIAKTEVPSYSPFTIFASFAPIVSVIVINYLFVEFALQNLTTDYLASEEFGQTSISSLGGLWSIIVALVSSIFLLMLLHWKYINKLYVSLSEGAENSILPIFNTASLVGFGAIVAALPAFSSVKEGVLALGADNPLISLAVAVNLLAALTGSASGGMSIALQSLGPTYLQIAEQTNTSPEVMHRVAAVSAGTLDALPHNGAVITLLSIAKLSHKQAYFNIFMVAVVFPIIALIVLITLATIFGNF